MEEVVCGSASGGCSESNLRSMSRISGPGPERSLKVARESPTTGCKKLFTSKTLSSTARTTHRSSTPPLSTLSKTLFIPRTVGHISRHLGIEHKLIHVNVCALFPFFSWNDPTSYTDTNYRLFLIFSCLSEKNFRMSPKPRLSPTGTRS